MSRWKCIYLLTRNLLGCKFSQAPLNTILCTREILTVRTRVHCFIIFLGMVMGQGFWLCTSLG